MYGQHNAFIYGEFRRILGYLRLLFSILLYIYIHIYILIYIIIVMDNTENTALFLISEAYFRSCSDVSSFDPLILKCILALALLRILQLTRCNLTDLCL